MTKFALPYRCQDCKAQSSAAAHAPPHRFLTRVSTTRDESQGESWETFQCMDQRCRTWWRLETTPGPLTGKWYVDPSAGL